jgi:hypothetical protein
MPYLIALTPRAGRWNHRYLVPPNLNLDTTVLGRLTSMAGQEAQGMAWLAVSHEVQQVGGSRAGKEILILGDLDVERLSPEAREHLLERLRHRLIDLGELITQEVDWEHEGRVDPVIRLELAQWYAVDFHPSGLVESRMPDWNLSSVISMKERKAIKDEKEKYEGKQQNEIKRVWVISSAFGGLGILLATIYYLFASQIFPDNVKVDNIGCKILDKSGENGSVCLLSKKDSESLCVIFARSNRCESRDLEASFSEIKDVQEIFDFASFASFAKQSDGDGFFSSGLVLTENKGDDNVKILDQEIFGVDQRGGRNISFDQYIDILRYQKKVKIAWQSLEKFNSEFVSNEVGQSPSKLWSASDYNDALLNIRRFLDELPKKIGNDGSFSVFNVFIARDFFNKDCFQLEANNNTPINDRLKCFDVKHKNWQDLKKDVKGSENPSLSKLITLFENIHELKSPLPKL